MTRKVACDKCGNKMMRVYRGMCVCSAKPCACGAGPSGYGFCRCGGVMRVPEQKRALASDARARADLAAYQRPPAASER